MGAYLARSWQSLKARRGLSGSSGSPSALGVCPPKRVGCDGLNMAKAKTVLQQHPGYLWRSLCVHSEATWGARLGGMQPLCG